MSNHPLLAFPPFYSNQPNYKLRKQYINTWTEIIIQDAIKRKQFALQKDSAIFYNGKIHRKADAELVQQIFQLLVQQKIAIQQKDGSLLVQPISVVKGADALYKALMANAMESGVYTFQEVRQAVQDTLLQCLGDQFLLQVLQQLQNDKQLTLIDTDAPQVDDIGVKTNLIK